MSLVEGIKDTCVTPQLTLTVLDERFSTNPEENNFALLTRTQFYNKAQEKGIPCIDTRVQPDETMQDLAKRFEDALRAWREKHPDGVIVATMGMGPDGHVSGMMPHPENKELFAIQFEQPETWVCGYDADGKNPYRYRVTTTMSFIKEQMDYAIAYITGADKRDSLARAMQSSDAIYEVPARVFHAMKAVDIFTDITL